MHLAGEGARAVSIRTFRAKRFGVSRLLASRRPYGGISTLGNHLDDGDGAMHVVSGSVLSSTGSTEPAGPRSMGRARRSRPSSMSKQTFVAIRYSHERSAPGLSTACPPGRNRRSRL